MNKVIYGHSKKVKKSRAFATISRVLGGESLLTIIDRSLHRIRRRNMSRGFSLEALHAFEATMLDHIRSFCDQLLTDSGDTQDDWTELRNMRELCSWLAFDVAGEFVFGLNFNTLETGDSRFMVNAILALNIRSGTYAQAPTLAGLYLDLLWWPVNCQILQKCLRWREDISQLIKKEQQPSKGSYPSISRALILPTGKELTETELMAETQVLLVAAFETTATTISSIFFYLAHYPISYSKVALEVRSTFTDVEEIRGGPQLASCQYLFASIQEAMRMSPAAVGAMWREIEPGGLCVDGELVPGGCDIGTCIYAIHHNEAYFPDSFTFAPERWLPASDQLSEKTKASHAAYNPFSLGPRACIGRPLAMLEISTVVARVMMLMDFRLRGDGSDLVGEGRPGRLDGRHRVKEFQLYSHLTSYAQGPMLEFRNREH